ncbi:MAG: DUF2079 domain-containing protein, partial [Planctomycetes bacterium]|nr:DUF2079 domain-containing protein [Planctomycetota bacterium]
MSSHHTAPLPSQNRMIAAASCFLAGTGMTTFGLQTILSSFELSSQFVSRRLWEKLVAALGASSQAAVNSIEIDPIILFLHLLPIALVFWLLGACWIAFRKKQPFRTAVVNWGIAGWLWWTIPGLWEIFNITCLNFTWERGTLFLNSTVALWFAVPAAGWLAALLTLSSRPSEGERSTELSVQASRTPVTVWLFVGLYAVVFITMNWQLYEGLQVPHGDSAMYEEHLWNVTHGKGFRSYLDGGLFLGEHLQLIHLLLIPLHFLWPSHLLLEVCESLALAAGAVPVYRMARRHCGSHQTAVWLAAAYLLYFPMQFLDIAIDLKTFRPISFGVPFMLFALDQMELRRYRSMLVFLVLALSAKEDYAVIIAMLGIWMAVFPPKENEQAIPGTPSRKSVRLLGAGLAVFGVVYLLVVIKLAIPWFREGDVHYAQYFGELGNTPGDILRSVMTQPELVFGKLFSHRSLIYVLLLLVPVGMVPLFSPGRLAVAAPLFGVLCLMELSPNPVPWHHFHAPLIPIIFWSAACGLGNLGTVTKRISRRAVTRFACSCALATGIVYGFSPLSLTFWDSGSTKHWKKLYVPGERAKLFPKVFALIPSDARVASTDFIHPRFTHHQRSYDYSDYLRAVNDGKPGVP